MVCSADNPNADGFYPGYYRDYGNWCSGASEWLGVTLVSGAVYGGIGAVIGHFIKSDRWVVVPLEKVQVSVGPAERGLGVSISSRF